MECFIHSTVLMALAVIFGSSDPVLLILLMEFFSEAPGDGVYFTLPSYGPSQPLNASSQRRL